MGNEDRLHAENEELLFREQMALRIEMRNDNLPLVATMHHKENVGFIILSGLWKSSASTIRMLTKSIRI